MSVLYFRKLLKKLVGKYRKKLKLNLTIVIEQQVGQYGFVVLENGHDYEVKVLKENLLVYHSVGFSSKEQAESFVEFYKKQL